MTKRLVKLRGTEKFRRVDNKTKGQAPVKTHSNGPFWEACNPSPFEQAIAAVRFIHFTAIKKVVTSIPFSNTSPFPVPISAKLVTSSADGGAWQPVKTFRPVSFLKAKPPCPKKHKFTELTFEQVQEQYINNNIQSNESDPIPMESE